MAVWLWHWNQSPIIPMKASRRVKAEKSTSSLVNPWRFCSLLSSIAMACCIMNSCHKVVWSIRNTTLKLCAYCAMQFIRNAQNCGETYHGFCTMITHQLTQRCFLLEFLGKNRNHGSTTGFGPRWLFPLPKTEDTAERKVFRYDWEDKRNIETGAVGNTKRPVSEVFWGLEKTLA